MTQKRNGLPYGRFLVVGLLVALDLWSKHAVFAWLDGQPEGVIPDIHRHPRYPVIGDWLSLMLSYNPGAAWGALRDFPHLLVIGRVIAVGLLAWLVIRTERGSGVMLPALVLVLAGALGNLHDNLFLEPMGDHPYGAVRDFIDVYFGPLGWDYHFPTFNVADSCITCGAVLLLLSGLFGKKQASQPDADSDSSASLETPAA